MTAPIILALGETAPTIADDVYLAPNCAVVGEVRIGAGSSVWFNATIRGDVAPITIGERTSVQDGAVLHVDHGTPCIIGNDVTIGHGAIVHGATVGDGVTIGMGAIVLSRSRVGAGSFVAAGAVVLEGTEVPPETLVAGVPAREKRQLDEAQRAGSMENAARYVSNAARYRAECRPVTGTAPEGSAHGG